VSFSALSVLSVVVRIAKNTTAITAPSARAIPRQIPPFPPLTMARLVLTIIHVSTAANLMLPPLLVVSSGNIILIALGSVQDTCVEGIWRRTPAFLPFSLVKLVTAVRDRLPLSPFGGMHTGWVKSSDVRHMGLGAAVVCGGEIDLWGQGGLVYGMDIFIYAFTVFIVAWLRPCCNPFSSVLRHSSHLRCTTVHYSGLNWYLVC